MEGEKQKIREANELLSQLKEEKVQIQGDLDLISVEKATAIMKMEAVTLEKTELQERLADEVLR